MNTSNESTNLWSLATDMDDDGTKAAETGASAWVKRAVEICLGQIKPLDLEALLQSTKRNSEAPEEEKLWFEGENGVFTRFFPLPNKSGFSDRPAVSRIFRLNQDAVDQVQEIHHSHAARQGTGTISYVLDHGHFKLFSVISPCNESLGIENSYGDSNWTTLYTNCKGGHITDLEQFPEGMWHTIQTFKDRENKRRGVAGDGR